jgi:hypothetical protein
MRTKEHVAVRLDEPTLDRLEAVRVVMGAKAADLGILLTQSEVLRAAVLAGLEVLERKHGVTPSKAALIPDRRARPPGKPRKRPARS